MTVAPIRPKQAKERKNASIPDFVVESFNELIAEHLSGGYALIKQAEILHRICSKVSELSGEVITPQQVLDKGWTDIESLFRKAGWKVTYDKPGYNESYDAFYKFIEK